MHLSNTASPARFRHSHAKHHCAALAIGSLLCLHVHSAAALTFNQQAVENAVMPGSFTSGQLSPIYWTMTDLPPEQYPHVYSKLSADVHGSFSSALMLTDLGIKDSPLANLRRSMDEQSSAPALWLRVGGGRQRIDDDGNAASIRNAHRDALLGGDLPMFSGWRLGGAIGKADQRRDSDSRDARANTDSESYSLYGGRDLKLSAGALRFFAGAAHSRHQLDSRRLITELESGAAGDYQLSTQQVFGELAFKMPLSEPGYLEPFFSLLLIEQKRDSFSEQGQLVAASLAEQTNRMSVSSLGTRGRQRFKLAGRDLLLNGTLTWRHLAGDLRPEEQVQLVETPQFQVRGTPMPANSYLLELKADYSVTRNLILDLDYNGAFSNQSRAHAISLNAHWKM